jgi:hypothetical protein
MKLGATPKKTAGLAGLLVFVAIAYFSGGDERSKSDSKKAALPPAIPGLVGPRAVVTPAVAKSNVVRPNSNRRTSQEFKPVLRPRRVEDRIDPATIDPTLRTDLLARLGSIPIQGGSRPLFDFGSAPPPKAPDPGKIIPVKPPPVAVAPVKPSGPVTPVAPVKPAAVPIPLKFYGFTSARAGAKRAFFLENEDVYVANEGDIVKKRYKVVRINMNSVLMEDTESKNQQTIPLTEQTQ